METGMVHRDHKVGSKGRGRDKDKDAITKPTFSLDLTRVDRRWFRVSSGRGIGVS